jgi:hypothetical protein
MRFVGDSILTINRHDFSLSQGVAVRLAASSMVTIELDLEAVQQAVEAQDTKARSKMVR